MTHAYEVMELVKLAYAGFDDGNQQVVAKDSFLKGLHMDMQVQLKTKYPKLEDVSLNDLAKEAQRLEIVGIKSTLSSPSVDISKVNDAPSDNEVSDELVEKLAKRVCEVLRADGQSNEVDINYTGYAGGSAPRQRGGQHQRFQRGMRRGSSRNQRTRTKNCFCCGSTEHVARECSERFCRHCGQKGHDAWDDNCPKRR